MSKIGKKPIALTTATVKVEGSRVAIKGPKGEMFHDIPDTLEVVLESSTVRVNVKKKFKGFAAVWGLHRAVLANKVKGVEQGFIQKVRINGLGFKAQPSDNKLVFSLGFSHKVEYVLPQEVKVQVDKTGQLLEFSSIDKFALGNACDAVRLLKLPEPYKATGIIRDGDVIIRKAGKAKSG
jgi:large subunit ribosomal protein L6